MGPATREIDVALLGATGFTGGLVADYLRAHAPAGARLALAGRRRTTLDEVSRRPGSDVELVTVDVDDPASLRRLAERTRVLVTTVGPYLRLGAPVVAACAESGTDYLDLTGEPEFVDLTYLRHHRRAEATGARLVHACGFDSVPHDLGAQFTVEQLPEDAAIDVRGYVRMHGRLSGGTVASAMEVLGRLRAARSANDVRREVEPVPAGRRVRVVTGRPGPSPETGWWVVPMPTIDPQVVARSARQLPRYGPDFSYSHYWAADGPLGATGVVTGVGLLTAAAQIPATRRLVTRLVPTGSGPSAERRARSWFTVRFVGRGGGSSVVTEVAGGDPGYTETAKMLSEAALCLAFDDDLPSSAGQVTSATAMGRSLRVRLQAAGIAFSVVG